MYQYWFLSGWRLQPSSKDLRAQGFAPARPPRLSQTGLAAALEALACLHGAGLALGPVPPPALLPTQSWVQWRAHLARRGCATLKGELLAFCATSDV